MPREAAKEQIVEKLYRFEVNFRRMGTLRGLFVADEERDIKPAIGKRVYFGEVLGKHSEIWLDALAPEHLTTLTDDASFISKFKEYGCASGLNPLDYISCPNCGDGATLEPPYTQCQCGWKLDS